MRLVARVKSPSTADAACRLNEKRALRMARPPPAFPLQAGVTYARALALSNSLSHPPPNRRPFSTNQTDKHCGKHLSGLSVQWSVERRSQKKLQFLDHEMSQFPHYGKDQAGSHGWLSELVEVLNVEACNSRSSVYSVHLGQSIKAFLLTSPLRAFLAPSGGSTELSAAYLWCCEVELWLWFSCSSSLAG